MKKTFYERIINVRNCLEKCAIDFKKTIEKQSCKKVNESRIVIFEIIALKTYQKNCRISLKLNLYLSILENVMSKNFHETDFEIL